MEKLTLFLIFFQLFFIRNCESFQNDNLVFSDNSVKYFERGSGGGEELENFLNKNSFLNFEWISSSIPGNSQCKTQMKKVLEEAKGLKIWALKILDASAKLPSGILSGNLNQYGDFDECLDSKGYAKDQIIQGKYCMANIDVNINENYTDNNNNNNLKEINAAIHSNWLLRSEFRDKGHRIPKFETFNLGICLPSVCNGEEIENFLTFQLNETFKNLIFKFNVAIDDDLCYVKEENNFSIMGLTVRLIFVSIFLFVVLGTLIEVKKIQIRNEKFSRILLCFSLKKNLQTLLKTTSPPDDINCIHGGRFINAVALLLSHKQMAMLFTPFINRTQMSESVSKSWTMVGRAACLYTDSFILFSGLLASYSMIKDLDSKKIMNFKEKFISRMFRLIPTLFGVIFFCSYIMDTMGSGPLWGLVVSKYTHLCRSNMWRNFLFIHNYFGFENMCMTHTHQLGTDTQLFLLSPIFIYLIWKMPKIGTLIIITVSTWSTWLRYDNAYQGHLSTLLHYGISVQRLWRTANMSYILPAHKLTIYLIGVYLGYYLRRGGRSIKLNIIQSTIGWIVAIVAALVAVFGHSHAAHKEYVYNAHDGATFNAFAPVLWTLFNSWALLACVNGYGGILNKVLTWKYFTIFTRISYAIYLTQFPIFFYFVGTERTAQHYKGIHSLVDGVELSIIFITSIILTLFFDIPFQEIKKLIKSQKIITREISKENSETASEENKRKGKRRRLQSFGT